jgi:SAM-dependent methyltransferase
MSPNYIINQNPEPWDDRALRDEWQREVYLIAASIMAATGFTKLHDYGCGSGFKTVTMLGQYETIGFETPEIVEWLRGQFPDRLWLPMEAEASPASLTICADVIEHVQDPDKLIENLKAITKPDGVFLISTPDRDLFAWDRAIRFGPPVNRSHVREWTFDEFERYMESHFEVRAHMVTNKEQTTQMVVCRQK